MNIKNKSKQDSYLLHLTLLDIDIDPSASKTDLECRLILNDQLLHTFYYSSKKKPSQKSNSQSIQLQQSAIFEGDGNSCIPFCLSKGEIVELDANIEGKQIYSGKLTFDFFEELQGKVHKWVFLEQLSHNKNHNNTQIQLLFFITKSQLLSKLPVSLTPISPLQYNEVLNQTQLIIQSVNSLFTISKTVSESQEAKNLNAKIIELSDYLKRFEEFLKRKQNGSFNKENNEKIPQSQLKKDSSPFRLSSTYQTLSNKKQNPYSNQKSRNNQLNSTEKKEGELNSSLIDEDSEFANMNISEMKNVLNNIQSDVNKFIGLLGFQVNQNSISNQNWNQRNENFSKSQTQEGISFGNLNRSQDQSANESKIEDHLQYKSKNQETCIKLNEKNEFLKDIIIKYNDQLLKNQKTERQISNKIQLAFQKQQTLLSQANFHNQEIEENWQKQLTLEKNTKEIKERYQQYKCDLQECLEVIKSMKKVQITELPHQIITEEDIYSDNYDSSQIDMQINEHSRRQFQTTEIQAVYDLIFEEKKECLKLQQQKNKLMQLKKSRFEKERGYKILEKIEDSSDNISVEQFFKLFRQKNGDTVNHYNWVIDKYEDIQFPIEQEKETKKNKEGLNDILQEREEEEEEDDNISSFKKKQFQENVNIRKTIQERKSALNQLLSTLDQI